MQWRRVDEVWEVEARRRLRVGAGDRGMEGDVGCAWSWGSSLGCASQSPTLKPHFSSNDSLSKVSFGGVARQFQRHFSRFLWGC